MRFILLVALIFAHTFANAGVNLYTEHRVSRLIGDDSHTEGTKYKSGDYPYLGQIGVEYDTKNITYSLSLIHRSNVDLKEYEYSYNGVSVGVKLKHCIARC